MMSVRFHTQPSLQLARRLAFTLALLALLTLIVLPSVVRSQNPVIQRAMRDEMKRNVSQLHLDSIPGPYFIAYRIDDQQWLSATASFGALISSNLGTSRQFRVGMRVGSPRFDNTNFFSFGDGSGLRYSMGAMGTTLEDNYDALRRDLWLTTDAAYKTALQDMARKSATFEHVTRSDDTVDFSPAPPFRYSAAPHVVAIDTTRLKQLVRRLSAVFAEYREIQSCTVNASAVASESYYLTSEGTDVAEPSTVVRIDAGATTQAADGMPLSDALLWVELLPRDLPSDAEMERQVRAMAERLVASRTAPVIDEYSGPVLIQRQAAAEVFGQFFDDAFCAIRRPDVSNPQMKMALTMLAKESPFQQRIGSRILPESFAVEDLPDRDTLGGVHCVGAQPDDDEGVPSANVRLVDHGVLKALLTCRTPHKRFTQSNGHGFSMPARPAISTLAFTDRKGISDAELKQKLLEQIKARDLPFGLRIARLIPSSSRTGDDQDRMMMMFMGMMGGDGGDERVTRPTEVYKVYPDGREELVRGVELGGIATAAFKEILAAGSNTFVYNTVLDLKSMSSAFQGADSKAVTLAVPDVLFDELSAKKVAGPFKTLPVVPAP